MTDEDHPYLNLNMGLVTKYTVNVWSGDSQEWLNQGWLPMPDSGDFNWYRKPGVITLGNRPQTLAELGADSLIGRRIIGYETALGSDGTGSGLGFFGFLLEP